MWGACESQLGLTSGKGVLSRYLISVKHNQPIGAIAVIVSLLKLKRELLHYRWILSKLDAVECYLNTH